MNVTCRHTIGELASDLRTVTRQAPSELREVVRQGCMAGNTIAKDLAKVSAGKHGKHYHKAMTWEMRPTFSGFGASVYSGEYGPQIDRRQGRMSFEGGSRNQPPHNDLAQSARRIGPVFANEVGDALDRLFWPGVS